MTVHIMVHIGSLISGALRHLERILLFGSYACRMLKLCRQQGTRYSDMLIEYVARTYGR